MGAYAFRVMLATLDEEVELLATYARHKVFSHEKANELLEVGRNALAIDTRGKDPLYGLIYNLSKTELAVLKEYTDDAERKG